MVQGARHLLDIHRDADRLEHRSGLICLDRNERVSPLAPDVHAQLLACLTSSVMSAYPYLDPLYEALMRLTGLPTEWLCTGAGSDSIIRRALHAFVEPGDVVLTTAPTYAMYEVYASIFRATCRTLTYRDDLTLDVDRLIAMIGEGAKVVLLANPDQPTGSAQDIGAIERIAQAANECGALLLVDEAYFPFVSTTALPLIQRFDNLLITRSFSKAYGIAGLRMGFGAAHPDIIKVLQIVRGSGEVNAAGAAIATWLLDNPWVTTEFVRDAEAGRTLLVDTAARLGAGTPTCHGNFQLLRLPSPISATEVAERLAKLGYLIKAGFQHPGMLDCIRVSIDVPAVMAPFCRTLEAVMAAVTADVDPVG